MHWHFWETQGMLPNMEGCLFLKNSHKASQPSSFESWQFGNFSRISYFHVIFLPPNSSEGHERPPACTACIFSLPLDHTRYGVQSIAACSPPPSQGIAACYQTGPWCRRTMCRITGWSYTTCPGWPSCFVLVFFYWRVFCVIVCSHWRQPFRIPILL